MTVYRGTCKCGAVSFWFDTQLKRERWPIRLCQCVYCRASRQFGPQSDLELGRVRFQQEEGQHLRYQIGLRTMDYLLCPHCQVMLGSILTDRTGSHAIISVESIIAELANPRDLPPFPPRMHAVGLPDGWTPVVSVI